MVCGVCLVARKAIEGLDRLKWWLQSFPVIRGFSWPVGALQRGWPWSIDPLTFESLDFYQISEIWRHLSWHNFGWRCWVKGIRNAMNTYQNWVELRSCWISWTAGVVLHWNYFIWIFPNHVTTPDRVAASNDVTQSFWRQLKLISTFHGSIWLGFNWACHLDAFAHTHCHTDTHSLAYSWPFWEVVLQRCQFLQVGVLSEKLLVLFACFCGHLIKPVA